MEKKEIIKIAIVGAESTGKTTLCEELAQHYNTIYVKEYARQYFDEHDINNYSINELDIIYKKQISQEDELIEKANKILFCDTAIITGKIWSDEVFKECSGFIEKAIKENKYDLYLLTENDLPWKNDGQRKNKHNRYELFFKHLHWLKDNNLPYVMVSGIGTNRAKKAIELINGFLNPE